MGDSEFNANKWLRDRYWSADYSPDNNSAERINEGMYRAIRAVQDEVPGTLNRILKDSRAIETYEDLDRPAKMVVNHLVNTSILHGATYLNQDFALMVWELVISEDSGVLSNIEEAPGIAEVMAVMLLCCKMTPEDLKAYTHQFYDEPPMKVRRLIDLVGAASDRIREGW